MPKQPSFLLPVLLFLLWGCPNSPTTSETPPALAPGWFFDSTQQDFHPLFKAVQKAGIYPDSKTFTDCQPTIPVDSILDLYAATSRTSDFDLRAFVQQWFTCPDGSSDLVFTSLPGRTIEDHISALWPVLSRPGGKGLSGTHIELPRAYVVPGGRFREMYYWDSYFTMLGLAAEGKFDLMEDMVTNFAWLIEQYGFVPNGTRTYYLSRSQPPFFAAMVNLLAQYRGDSVYQQYLPALEREYDFWMDGADGLYKNNSGVRRVVRLADGSILNRYWDDLALPRPESFTEDLETAEKSPRNNPEVWRDLRAAAESGWDFSSRWLEQPDDLSSIHTTDFIPVDLNALLYHLEQTLAHACQLEGEMSRSQHFEEQAHDRKEALQKYCWSDSAEFYFDYEWPRRGQSRAKTLAGIYPLFFEMASPGQAEAIATQLRNQFLADGGLLTTLVESGQQWDAPNGWAPLQWMAWKGLKQYGQEELAKEIADRWINNNLRVYANTGKLVEKYVVTDTTLLAGGGEYALQDGFGWTNGVLLALLRTREGQGKLNDKPLRPQRSVPD